jgi:hypothetical protein
LVFPWIKKRQTRRSCWLMPFFRQTSTTLSPDSASRKTRRISSSLCPRLAILQFSSRFQRTTTGHSLSTSKWLSFWVLGQGNMRNQRRIATPLTQRHRTEGRGNIFAPNTKPVLGPEKICRSCEVLLKAGQNCCASCARPMIRAILAEGMKRGQVAAHSQRQKRYVRRPSANKSPREGLGKSRVVQS